jgi:hypothetical protein
MCGLLLEPDLDGVAVGEQALGAGQCPDGLPDRGEPSRSMRWTWLNLPYVSTDSAGRSGKATGRQRGWPVA